MVEDDKHLGDVLMMLADLHPDDRCQAFEDALAFYNGRHPEAIVQGIPGYVTRLVSEGPLDRAIAALTATSPSLPSDSEGR